MGYITPQFIRAPRFSSTTCGNIITYLFVINNDYVGSWHAAPFVGSGYAERFVFYVTGNYVYFPSQYQCDPKDTACTPAPIRAGTWGITGDQINTTVWGDIDSMISTSVGKVIEADANESPYAYQTEIGGESYWLMSRETNLWNVVTGELCP